MLNGADSKYAEEQARRIEQKSGSIARPQTGDQIDLDVAVVQALPIPGTDVIAAFNYGISLWGRAAKISCHLPNGNHVTYFLKRGALGDVGRLMVQGEFASLKEMHGVSPTFVPRPLAWGRFQNAEPEQFFLLTEFRNVGEQPPEPIEFTARLAEMHRNSISPTGKFGFHISTYHAMIPQVTHCWGEKWSKLYQKQFGLMVKLDLEQNVLWAEFKLLCDLTVEKVIPRLLEPLQSEGRTLKPCLVHGDLWDENAATDGKTGEPFVFDCASFYGHNEYDIGNWRTRRHRLSSEVYISNYKRNFPPSEPEEEWDARNLLYSLRYELHAAILYPESKIRQVVFDGMTELCLKYCPEELRVGQKR